VYVPTLASSLVETVISEEDIVTKEGGETSSKVY